MNSERTGREVTVWDALTVLLVCTPIPSRLAGQKFHGRRGGQNRLNQSANGFIALTSMLEEDWPPGVPRRLDRCSVSRQAGRGLPTARCHSIASAHSCAPRSQAISPCRGSDPAIARKRPYRREPVPVEPAAAAARSRVSPNPLRLARAASRSIAASASATSPSAPRCSSVSTRRPVARKHSTAGVVPRGHIVDGRAHERYRIIAISMPRSLTCQIHVDDR